MYYLPLLTITTFLIYSRSIDGEIFVDPLVTITVILVLSFMLGHISKKLSSYALIGYILAGIMVGPILNMVNVNSTIIDLLNDLSFSFIAFELGLLFPLRSSKSLKGYILMNIVVFIMNLAMCYLILASKYSLTSILLVSLYTFNTSTILGLRILMDDLVIDELSKNMLVGILSTSDLVTLAIMTIIPSLGVINSFSISNVKVPIVNLLVTSLSLCIISLIMTRAATLKLRNLSGDLSLLFLASILSVYLLISKFFGLPSLFGAFIIGMLLSSSSLGDVIKNRIGILNDISVYVISLMIGLSFPKGGFTLHDIFTPLLMLPILLIIKSMCLSLVLWFSGMTLEKAITLAICLMPLSEFSVVIAREGALSGIITNDLYLLGIISMPFSIFISRLFLRYTSNIVPRLVSIVPENVRVVLEESFSVIREAFGLFLSTWFNRSLFWLVIRKLTVLSVVLFACVIVLKIVNLLPIPLSLILYLVCAGLISTAIFIVLSDLGKVIGFMVLDVIKRVVAARYTYPSRKLLLTSMYALIRILNIWGAIALTMTALFSMLHNFLKGFPIIAQYTTFLIPLQVFLIGGITYRTMRKLINKLEGYIDELFTSS